MKYSRQLESILQAEETKTSHPTLKFYDILKEKWAAPEFGYRLS
jgi:hypothetical protein